ncbi:MAG: hypothetical protein Q8P18_05085 [Pseudomonadota bacterium]|nr:hypothetical protein [Pseudomonadota bacterium]
MRVLTMVLIVAALAAAGWAWLFGPYWVDYFKMQDVAGSAVLSWAAYDETRGRSELAEQLKFREIPDYLTPDACRFYIEAGGIKVVDCAWTVDVYIPLVEEARRLSFSVVQSASTDGRLLK